MEVCVNVAGVELNLLAGGQLGLHLGSSLRVVTSVHAVIVAVQVLRNGDGLQDAINTVDGAVGVNLGKMDGVDLINGVGVVIVLEGHVGSGEVTTHDALGVDHVPVVTVEAGHILGVDQQGRVVAWGLGFSIALHLQGGDHALQDSLGGLDVDAGLVAEQNLIEELNHGGGGQSVCLGLGHIGDQVLVAHVDWGLARQELSVGDTLESNSGEQVSLGGVDVEVRVPERLSDTGKAHEAILGATNGKSGHIVVDLGRAIIVDGSLLTSQDGTHQDLSLDDVSVIVGVALGHDTTERVTSNDDVVAGEAQVSQSGNGRGNLAGQGYWIRRTSDEIRDSDKDALAFGNTLGLDLFSDRRVGSVVAESALNPDDSDISAGISNSRESDKLSISNGSSGRESHGNEEVLHLINYIRVASFLPFGLLIVAQNGSSIKYTNLLFQN